MHRIDGSWDVDTTKFAVESWLTARNSRDVALLTDSLNGMSWKTTPRVSLLLEYSDLLHIFTHGHNVVPKLSHVILVEALMQLHTKKACLFGAKHISAELLASSVSARVRCILQKLRTAREDADTKTTLLRKVFGGK